MVKRERYIECKLRLNPKEVKELKTQNNQKSRQQFLLELALNGKVNNYDYSELCSYQEVNAIGRNVNQIVRYIHETGTVEPEALRCYVKR